MPKDEAETVITNCVTNADQSALYKGQWKTKPVPLAVVATDFSASELEAIEAGISTWNDFFQDSKGFRLFLSGSSQLVQVNSIGARTTSSTACSQAIVGPAGFSGKIMIYKNGGSWAYGSSVIALTSLCPVATANSTYKMFISALLEINYVNFFVTGKPIPDLQSVMVHELGHILGLDHSCNGSACSKAPAEYVKAVMYPSLGFSGAFGVQKRTLNSNDQGRANCLY